MAREEQKQRSEQVRQAILDTALQIGLEEGFEELSIRKIIGRMNYSTGVVYHHFADKQEILDAIEESETRWLYAQIANIYDPKQDAVTNMTAVFRRVLQLAMEDQEKYNLIVLHKYSRKKSTTSAWLERIAQDLRKDMDAGKLKKMNAESAAFCIWSSFLGFHLMISRANVSQDEAERLFETQVSIVFGGLLS